MSEEQDQFEQIEKYLQNQEEGDAAFREDIARDKALKEEVDIQHSVMTGVENAAIREEIMNIHQRHHRQKDFVANDRYPVWTYAVAAGLALLVLAFFGYQQYFGQAVDHQELYSEYFEPYPDAISLRGDQSREVAQAMSLYASGSYQEAIDYFETTAEGTVLSDDVQFYWSLCDMSIGENKSAIQRLSTLQERAESRFLPQITWYLALAYLGDGNGSKCKDYLNLIKEEDFRYQEAQRLLSTI